MVLPPELVADARHYAIVGSWRQVRPLGLAFQGNPITGLDLPWPRTKDEFPGMMAAVIAGGVKLTKTVYFHLAIKMFLAFPTTG